MNNNYAVIMAGGIGSRFWPISRTSHPKQFLDVFGKGKTLLQNTYERFLQICPKQNIFVVTNTIYLSFIHNQLPDLDNSQILGEPLRKNTAPCIAYACYKIKQINPKANIVVAPSDHIIQKEENFIESINFILNITKEHDILVTLGIQPNRPDTGYGYIQYNEESKFEKLGKVKTFTEKPDLELAKSFLQSGDFLWNSGIFIWNAQSIIKSFDKHLPEISDIFKEGNDIYFKPEEKEFINKAYVQCTNISIDYGIMEKAKNVFILPVDFGWSDIGTWGSLYELHDTDHAGNAITGNSVMLYNTSNCMIKVPDDKLVVLQGLDDYIIVESDNILLVCKKSEEQKIKQIVSDVKRIKGEKFI